MLMGMRGGRFRQNRRWPTPRSFGASRPQEVVAVQLLVKQDLPCLQHLH